jgi:hypothetical protein
LSDEKDLRGERGLRRADAYMHSALGDEPPGRSPQDIAADARRWALAMRDGKTILNSEFFATQFDMIADLADWVGRDGT